MTATTDPRTSLLRAHELLSEAHHELDGAVGLLPGIQHAACLDARDGIARAMKQCRALALFSGASPQEVGP
jgi:hypothetical protein